MIDGGTQFRLSAEITGFRSPLKTIVKNVLADPPVEPRVLELSIVDLPGRYRWWGSTDLVVGEVTFVRKVTRQVVMHFHYRAYVRIDVDRETVKVEAKAPELWQDGIAAWMSRWLDLFSWLTGGPGCTPETAREVRWATSRVQLASDFVGIRFVLEDAQHFTGRASPHVDLTPDGTAIESITVGDVRSASQLKVYDKTRQIRCKLRIDPEASVYAPTWLDSRGYSPGQEIWRVEQRFSGSGLRLEVRDSDGQPTGEGVDLTNPATLADRGALRRVWASEAARVRLYVPGRSRRSRCHVDARWALIQAAADCAGLRLVRHREVQRLTHAQRVRRAEVRAAKVALEYAALHGRPEADVCELARVAAAMVLGADLDVETHRARVAAALQFLEEECREAAPTLDALLRTVESRLASAAAQGWRAVPQTPSSDAWKALGCSKEGKEGRA